jgi:hypothetical protein
VLISTTRACRNQAFRFKNRLFGFQYHFELAEADIERMLEHGKDELAAANLADAATKVRDETKMHYPRYARLGDRILGNFVQFLKQY